MVTAVKRMKGSGRIAFLAQQNEIAAELKAGWPIKASYLARTNKLGISYQQFTRYVDAYIPADQRSVPRVRRAQPSSGSAPPSPPSAPVPPRPTPPTLEEAPIHARPDSRPRTFVYDGNPKQDDKARLIGTGAREPKA